jgi:hypothetical protein
MTCGTSIDTGVVDKLVFFFPLLSFTLFVMSKSVFLFDGRSSSKRSFKSTYSSSSSLSAFPLALRLSLLPKKDDDDDRERGEGRKKAG